MAALRFPNLLKQRIEEAIDAHIESVMGGQAPDYARYREGVGYVAGLSDAIKLLEELDREYQ